MEILSLKLQNFRNFEFLDLDAGAESCFFYGANGHGKTNLLEAVGFVSALRSFRTRDIRHLIRWEIAETRMLFGISRNQEHDCEEIEIHFGADGRKGVRIDEEKISRFADFIGRFPTVPLTSQDIQLLRGSPGMRRRFLDLAISSVDSDYLEALRRYNRALRSRNTLLRNGGARSERVAFDHLMAPEAIRIIARR